MAVVGLGPEIFFLSVAFDTVWHKQHILCSYKACSNIYILSNVKNLKDQGDILTMILTWSIINSYSHWIIFSKLQRHQIKIKPRTVELWRHNTAYCTGLLFIMLMTDLGSNPRFNEFCMFCRCGIVLVFCCQTTFGGLDVLDCLSKLANQWVDTWCLRLSNTHPKAPCFC